MRKNEQFLFVSHRLRRVNVGYQIAWRDQDKNADEECDGVEQQDQRDVQFHWSLTDVIGLWIQ